jgi:Predicted ATPase
MPSSATVRRTFLFTDIESSTRLWDQFPDAMLSALEQHDRLLREAITRAGGHVTLHTGDGFVAAFSSAGAAVEAALAAQRALAVADFPVLDGLKVRMGVHSGDVVERDGDFFGWALNVTARLHALAHGGQIVVSGIAESEAERGMTERVEFLDLGMHRLRDVAEPIRVYTVLAEGLPGRFDDVRGAARPVATISRSLTNFVGRAAEIERLREQLLTHRLVTLVGLAGVGKTRLAVEAASCVEDRFADGVVMCEFSGVLPSQVGAALGKALGVERRTLRSAEESVVEWLHDKELLLILDNCEEATESVGELALAVSLHAPRCHLLATSRESLGVPGEHVTMLQPLRAEVATDDSVELFLERARAAGADLVDDARTRALARDVCRAVAGVPLAIEIAASNASSLSLADILEAVRAGELPTSGRTLTRHRSVDDSLDLTFDRLDPTLREAFVRCSVLPGSFDRAAFAAQFALPLLPADTEDLATALDKLRLSVGEDQMRRWGRPRGGSRPGRSDADRTRPIGDRDRRLNACVPTRSARAAAGSLLRRTAW